ncbi:unnamed protein product [Vitrella brassicaformis CCMP3155]|uniref:Uncharacterized protein n=1 Tax=Vitrella brassicaformis (strain CCMP3155) TaxID=1169540 RepID=A0A0G4EE98_VITBC|nr:unnamed protein product [Vitrella brassicaformis CCMP3155]|eukprot:CEL94307.1 unnamed protein product [Vitrella brassicaformis CCMP3155]
MAPLTEQSQECVAAVLTTITSRLSTADNRPTTNADLENAQEQLTAICLDALELSVYDVDETRGPTEERRTLDNAAEIINTHIVVSFFGSHMDITHIAATWLHMDFPSMVRAMGLPDESLHDTNAIARRMDEGRSLVGYVDAASHAEMFPAADRGKLSLLFGRMEWATSSLLRRILVQVDVPDVLKARFEAMLSSFDASPFDPRKAIVKSQIAKLDAIVAFRRHANLMTTEETQPQPQPQQSPERSPSSPQGQGGLARLPSFTAQGRAQFKQDKEEGIAPLGSGVFARGADDSPTKETHLSDQLTMDIAFLREKSKALMRQQDRPGERGANEQPRGSMESITTPQFASRNDKTAAAAFTAAADGQAGHTVGRLYNDGRGRQREMGDEEGQRQQGQTEGNWQGGREPQQQQQQQQRAEGREETRPIGRVGVAVGVDGRTAAVERADRWMVAARRSQTDTHDRASFAATHNLRLVYQALCEDVKHFRSLNVHLCEENHVLQQLLNSLRVRS